MARRSSLKRLPLSVLDQLDKRIAEDRETLEELLDWLVETHDVNVSRSALQRYSIDIRTVAARMNEVTQMSSAIASEVGDLADDQTMQMLLQGIQSILFRFSMQAQEEEGAQLDPKDLHYLTKSVKELGQAQRQILDLKEKAREQARAEAEAALDDAEQSGTLDPEAARSARLALGFT